MRILVYYLVLVLVISSQCFASQSNWPDWRGPDHNRVAQQGDYPVDWSPETIQWKVEIPGRGYSTPVVWDNNIFLTTGAQGQDTAMALDLAGNELWQTQLGAEVEGRHRNATGSNSSATTDGNAVFVFFKSGNFAALELDGTIRWQRNLFEQFGADDRFWDFGTSPALTQEHVVMAQMHDGDSWVAAFDKATGEVAWKVSRNYETPRENRQGYTTPIVFSHEGTEALLVWGAEHLTAHDAANGNVIWLSGGFNPENSAYWPAVASPAISGDIAVVPFGRADRRQGRLHGVRMGGTGNVTETHRLWKRDDTGSFIPTPVAYNGHVYLLHDLGHLECIDPETGQSLWSAEFPQGRGAFYTSPLIAGGHLYAARDSGIFYVVSLGDDGFEVVFEIDMEEKIIASPIALDNRILIRTESHLYCIGNE